MEKRKNLCAMIPESLHNQVRTEQEKMALTLSQYVETVLNCNDFKIRYAMGGRV